MPKKETARRTGKGPTGKSKDRTSAGSKTISALESKATPQRDVGDTLPETTGGKPIISLYDLVCPKDGKLESGLEFGACMRAAREHNAKNPGHRANCLKRQP